MLKYSICRGCTCFGEVERNIGSELSWYCENYNPVTRMHSRLVSTEDDIPCWCIKKFEHAVALGEQDNER